jgi:hypothetical protein
MHPRLPYLSISLVTLASRTGEGIAFVGMQTCVDPARVRTGLVHEPYPKDLLYPNACQG